MNDRPMKRLQQGFGVAVLALALVLGGCDTLSSSQQATPEAPALTAVADGIAQDLALPEATAEDLKASLARYEDEAQEPGFLWTVAADLQQRLSDAQKAALFERMETRRQRFEEGRPGQHGPHGMRGMHGRGGPRGEALGAHLADALDLTEAQQTQLKALREEHRAAVETLAQARRDGSLTPEAFRERAQTLREEMKADLDAVLTDEQQAQLEAMRETRGERRQDRREEFAERREAGQAVQNEVLGLTAAQQDALEALRAEHREQRQALMESVRAGETDRADLFDEIKALREAGEAARAEILEPTQLEIVQLHALLARHAIRHHARQYRGERRGAGPQMGR